MRFEDNQTFSSFDRIGPSARTIPDELLPFELAFLPQDEVDCTTLAVAARTARDVNECAASVLIADGHLSAARYYRALARHLDLDFVDGWPEIAKRTDVASAHALGRVELARALPARWLVAPRGREICRLLSDLRARSRPTDMAITTPAHLAAIIHYHSESAVEHIACHALPDEKPRLSARGMFGQKTGLLGLLGALSLLTGLLLMPRVVGFLSGVLFFAGICFRLIIAAGGLDSSDELPPDLCDADLPTYTVLIPLRDEGDIVPDLLTAIEAIDYPRAKLEVLVLIEPEDRGTRVALTKTSLPPWVHIVFGPRGGSLRTKPRALNIGLLMARGELLTVFDAEDRPDADQLRRAAAAFVNLPKRVACLQARLAIDNGANALLARMFALEYAFLFDVLNVGIANRGLPMALGGTSNHFRTASLREAGGWDAWNVTEDADLGIRLARLGFGVVSLASTTLEVAPERPWAWAKQRRRWMKGWMQTFLVLLRDLPRLSRELGPSRSGALALLLVNLVIGPLLFPVFSAYVCYRLVQRGLSTPSSMWELLEATLEAAVVLFGAASTLWCSYVGMRVRKLGAFLSSLPMMLLYQLVISAAAWVGLLDLIRAPYHWHKTDHAARHEKTAP